jgi:hypothetical protein
MSVRTFVLVSSIGSELADPQRLRFNPPPVAAPVMRERPVDEVVVRDSVSSVLTRREEDPLLGIIGLIDDSGARPYGDVGEAHDAYLADAVAAEVFRKLP